MPGVLYNQRQEAESAEHEGEEKDFGEEGEVRPKIHPKDMGLKFARVLKRGKPRQKASRPEKEIQDLVEQYCDLLHVHRLHIPEFLLASAFRNRQLSGAELWAARDAAEEIRGLPDLLLFRAGRFLAIEIKTEIGKMAAAQELWQARLGTVLCRSFEAAKEEIDRWLAGQGKGADHG